MAEQEEGRWVTLKNGTRVFIKDGQTLEEAIQDREKEKVDLERYFDKGYKTEDVERYADGKLKPNIFDTNETGYIQKNEEAKDKRNIIMMTPNEYFDLVEKGFGVSAYEQIKMVKNDDVDIEYLTEVLTKKGKKLTMPYIDMNKPDEQEGRHRMYIAGEMFGWNKSFPVLATNNSKTKLMKPSMREILEKKFNGYKVSKLKVEDIIKDNNIRDNEATLNTRKGWWGESYDDYKLNEAQYNFDQDTPIKIAKKGNKYEIEDGRHRLIALQNAGYRYAELLVRDVDEEEKRITPEKIKRKLNGDLKY